MTQPQIQGPTATEKIRNAEVMYGTGSPQHKAAIRRYGRSANAR